MHEVHELLSLIWAFDHALHGMSKKMARTLSVTGLQRFVIRIIGRFPGIPAGKVAEILHIHPSTISGVLQRLEKHGFVQRRRDTRDSRRSFLGLTDKGRRLDVKREGTIEACVQRVLADVSKQELDMVKSLMEKLVRGLEDEL
ncbi:MAG: MarR family winged helix-turn-helix transcriptional regulator [Pseudomonadota bacterium]